MGKRGEGADPEELRCDFCGKPSPDVRRVALDGDYERLRTPHREKYACWKCSKDKEEERLGLKRRPYQP